MALATFGIASAQTPGAASDADATQAPDSPAPESAQVPSQSPPALELEGQQEVSMSPEEMRTQSVAALNSIEAVSATVQAMLTAARDQRDVVRVLCLDDKQNQISVALSTARDRSTAMTDALSRGATERAQHEFTLLMVLKERVDVLVGEANQCVGEEVGFTGDSEVEVQVDPNLPDTEPGLVDVIPIVAIPPGPSSPID